MNRINFLITIVLLITSFNLQAQNVKLKKGKVVIDNNEIMKYEKTRGGNDLSIYDFDGNELIFVKREVNSNPEKSYAIVNFLNYDLSFETKSQLYSFKKLIKELFKSKVITEDGLIDEKKAKIFVKKYDENITNRTIIIGN
nr:hypothetical protein [uncultured Psychroserpens sp.]